MEASEIESLAMLARGFVDLKDANPELAYKVILDILGGINEYGTFPNLLFSAPDPTFFYLPRTEIKPFANTSQRSGAFSLTSASYARAS